MPSAKSARTSAPMASLAISIRTSNWKHWAPRSQWDSANHTRTILWPEHAQKGELPANLRSPEDAANSPRVKIAVEVIRRLNSLLRDEPLLLAGVTGPFTLAARLTQLDADELLGGKEPSEAVLEVAAATTTQIAAALVEAGANVIFIREEILPPLSLDSSQAWSSLLTPTLNIIRFYEALPVLQLGGDAANANNLERLLQQQLAAVICIPATEVAIRAAGQVENSTLGVALPLAMLEADNFPGNVQMEISNLKLALLTTDGDVPVTTDLKLLMKTFDLISRKT